MDKRKNNGGARSGAGRKPKAKELELIERLTPYDDTAITQLMKGVENGTFACIKLFMEYRYGKPKEQLKLETTEPTKPPSIIWLGSGTNPNKSQDSKPIDPLS